MGEQADNSISEAAAKSLGFVSDPSALYWLQSLPGGRLRHREFCEVKT